MSEAVFEHADHFQSFDQQARASRLGMWVFLASEVLLFAGMFALYTGYRLHYPQAFAEGVRHDLKWDGSLNTLILLVSSYLVARSVPSTRAGHRRSALVQLGFVVLLGLAFLGLKLYEYASHFSEGIIPGGRTPFFAEHPTPGLPAFFTLYYLMTGAHALHVTIGLAVIIGLMIKIGRARRVAAAAHPLEVGALYWHLIDVIWIFLWPLFYLVGGR